MQRPKGMQVIQLICERVFTIHRILVHFREQTLISEHVLILVSKRTKNS